LPLCFSLSTSTCCLQTYSGAKIWLPGRPEKLSSALQTLTRPAGVLGYYRPRAIGEEASGVMLLA
jgi:hypothetical protein